MSASFLLPILIAVVLNIIIGALWYSPLMFQKIWLKENGFKKGEPIAHSLPSALIATIVSSTLTSAILLYYLELVRMSIQQPSGYGHVLIMVANGQFFTVKTVVSRIFTLWLAFVFAIRLSHHMFERRSWAMFWIVSIHDLVSMMVIGLTFYFWR